MPHVGTGVPTRTGGPVPWYLVATALLVHVLLVLSAGRLVTARLQAPPPEKIVTVHIIAEVPPPPVKVPEPANLPREPAPPQPASDARLDAPPVAPVDADGLTPAVRTYAQAALADPRSREVRLALPLLAVDERLVQLCNLEAMEQVRLSGIGLEPEAVVAYAMADLETGSYTLHARGAAFRVGRHWYNIAYKCTARADYRAVTDFAYKVGDEIPRSEWASHDLALDIGQGD